MKQRILCWTNPKGVRFLPQWHNGYSWHWYFGHDDSGSPYVHILGFATREEALTFIMDGPETPDCVVAYELLPT